jgi:hypothetical protein
LTDNPARRGVVPLAAVQTPAEHHGGQAFAERRVSLAVALEKPLAPIKAAQQLLAQCEIPPLGASFDACFRSARRATRRTSRGEFMVLLESAWIEGDKTVLKKPSRDELSTLIADAIAELSTGLHDDHPAEPIQRALAAVDAELARVLTPQMAHDYSKLLFSRFPTEVSEGRADALAFLLCGRDCQFDDDDGEKPPSLPIPPAALSAAIPAAWREFKWAPTPSEFLPLCTQKRAAIVSIRNRLAAVGRLMADLDDLNRLRLKLYPPGAHELIDDDDD